MKKEYIVLSIIIVVLAGILFLNKRNRVNYTIPSLDVLKDQQVTRLVINAPGEETTLTRNGDIWEVQPQGFKADGDKVSSMISRLSNLSISALVSEQKHYQIYDLSGEKKISVTAFAGDDVVRGLDIGKTAASGKQTYILLAGDTNVYLANGNIRREFDTTGAKLRDLKVMAINEDISAISLISGGKKTVLTQTAPPPDLAEPDAGASAPEDEAAPEQPEPPKPSWVSGDGKTAASSVIEAAVSTMKALTCEKYIDNMDKDKLGEPVYTITLKGAKQYTVSLYAKTKDNRYPATSTESDHPFYLPEWKAKKLMPDEKALFPEGT